MDQDSEETPLLTPTVRVEEKAILEERGGAGRVSSSHDEKEESKYDCTRFNNSFFYKAAQQLMLLNSVELEALDSELGLRRASGEIEADLRVIVNS